MNRVVLINVQSMHYAIKFSQQIHVYEVYLNSTMDFNTCGHDQF